MLKPTSLLYLNNLLPWVIFKRLCLTQKIPCLTIKPGNNVEVLCRHNSFVFNETGQKRGTKENIFSALTEFEFGSLNSWVYHTNKSE